MVLQSSGPIKFSEIQTELGGTNPIALSEYNLKIIPAIIYGNPISLSKFYNIANNILFFNLTNSIQSITIPPNVNSILVYCWGAGAGGNGGFVKAVINTSSIKSLAIIVGAGGYTGKGNKTFGGGGSGSPIKTTSFIRSGGGLSGIFINNSSMTITNNNIINSNATPIIIAGGGGGHGGYYDIYNSYAYGGGHGGSDTGNDGINYYLNINNEVSGKGGTQISGGYRGIGDEGVLGINQEGNKFYGGDVGYIFNARGSETIGGGGGGYYGGGGGTSSGGPIGAGGGGSSYINPTYVTTIYNNDKSINSDPPGLNQPYYKSGIATNNGNGYIVIIYQ